MWLLLSTIRASIVVACIALIDRLGLSGTLLFLTIAANYLVSESVVVAIRSTQWSASNASANYIRRAMMTAWLPVMLLCSVVLTVFVFPATESFLLRSLALLFGASMIWVVTAMVVAGLLRDVGKNTR